VDSYTDEHYDITLSIDKDGKPKIERIYGNKRLSDLKGALKVFVKGDYLAFFIECVSFFKGAGAIFFSNTSY
jgi:hypothetical protein